MPLKITASGYIQVHRGGVFVSRHNTVEDAVESCVAHAAVHGEGVYDITYPTRRVSITVPLTIIKNQLGGVGTTPNRAPIWSIDTEELTTGVAYSLNLNTLCADPDGNPLTFSQVSGTLPVGLSFAAPVISGTPTTVETPNVTFRADDGTDTTDAILTFEVLNPDTVAPSAVVLTPTVYSTTEVNLTWTVSVDSAGVNQRVSGLSGYRIYRDGNLIQTIAAPTTTYNDTGLSSAVTYQYYIRPIDVAGNVGVSSNVVSVQTDSIAPSVPANVIANGISTSTIRVTWNAATDTGGSGLAGYRIYLSTDGVTAWSLHTTVAAPTTSYDHTGLAAQVTRYYRVTSYDNANNESTYTGQAVGVTLPQSGGALLDWGGISHHTLEVLRPKTGLHANDRIYAAYPGLEYNIGTAAVGGVPPYRYSLSNAPAGMTINQDTGVISWPNPQATASNIVVTVLDTKGVTATGTWSITVATTRFLFISATGNDTTGAGTLASPWRTVSKAQSTGNNTHIVMMDSGSYDCVGIADTGDGPRFAQQYNNPCVWVKREGATVNWNVTNGTRTTIDVRGDNLYFDGIRFTGWGGAAINSVGFFKQIGDYSVWRRCAAHDYGPGVESANSSFIMWISGNFGDGTHDLNVIQDCEFYNQITGDVNCTLKIYATNKLLVERCYFHDFQSTTEGAIANKAGNTFVTVRGCYSGPNMLAPCYGGNQNAAATGQCDVEFCFNNFVGPAGFSLGGLTTVLVNHDGTQDSASYYFRNTIRGGFTIDELNVGDGPFNVYNNVIVNETTNDNPDGSHIDHGIPPVDISRLVLTDNLAGNAANAYVDANGLLQGASRTSYLYYRGHEVSGTTQTSWQLATDHYIPAKMVPNIIHPRPDSETIIHARHRKAPSAIEWRCPIVVQGGAWPFRYELVTAPAGATIGETLPSDWLTNGLQNYGVIVWPSPTVGQHNWTVRVTDQDGTVVTRSWAMQVYDRENTTHFIFVNAATGSNSNSGAYSSPKLNFAGWYGTDKNDSTHDNKQAFYFSGTYSVAAFTHFEGGNLQQVPCHANKPGVHVTMPGASVTFDNNNQAYWKMDGSEGDQYFEGMSWINPTVTENGVPRKTHWRSGGNGGGRFTQFRVRYVGNPSVSADSTNSNCYMFGSNPIGNPTTFYHAVVQCIFDSIDYQGAGLHYHTNDVVIEGCLQIPSGNGNDGGIYLKANTIRRVSCRANRSSGIMDAPFLFFSQFDDDPADVRSDIEFCWNKWRNDNANTANEGAGGVGIGQGTGANGNHYGRFWSYRNNVICRHTSLIGIGAYTPSPGPFEFQNDVIQHSGAYTDGFYFLNSSQMPARLIKTNLNTNTSGLLDGTTVLRIGGPNGTHGCEVA